MGSPHAIAVESAKIAANALYVAVIDTTGSERVTAPISAPFSDEPLF